MRLREFIAEYNQAKTTQVLGEKLLSGFARAERSSSVPDNLYNAWTLQQMALKPDGYPEGTRRFDLFGKMVEFNTKNAPEIYQQIKPTLIRAILTVLESADPTRNKEYVPWIARLYSQGQMTMEDITSTIQDYLYKFVILKRKHLLAPPTNDINQYKTFGQFMTTMDRYELPEDEAADKGQARTVFDSDNVRVVIPEDQAAACYYGRGTRWCTAATRGENYFDRYHRQGSLYILLPKHPMHPGEKYQLHFGAGQYMDEQDNPVDLHSLLTQHFPESIKFFLESEPELRNDIFFAPDSVIDAVLKSCNRAIQDAINDRISEIEMDDDYWYQYLRDEFPSKDPDDPGGIDWAAVEASRQNYLSDNTELATQVTQVEDAIPKNAAELRSAVTELLSSGYSDLDTKLTSLDKVLEGLAGNAVLSRNRHNYDLGIHVAQWIQEHLQITQSPSGKFHVRTFHRTSGAKPTITDY